MAVVQISRIQIRRGQKNTSSGLPQLASGELAWAIDTQELYIGNGAVSEGAPYVGNTKIITEQDNLLELVGSYQFAKNNPAIQTGPNANQPVLQNLQDVIDQFVTASNFGITGDGVTDDTEAIQRAIDQLFLNPAAYQTGIGATIDARTEIQFGPGTYIISDTIYLPSYVFITGSGSEHTIFQYTGDGLAFKFVNADSAIGEYTTDNVTPTNQPKHAILRDFSIRCISGLASGLELNCVSASRFENLSIDGSYLWDGDDFDIETAQPTTPNKCGLILLGGFKEASDDTIPTTERNVFNNLSISNFAICVRGDANVAYNNFTNCDFYHAFYGVVLGKGAGGPRNNLIAKSIFRYINKHGVYLYDGTGNTISDNKFENVGNDNGLNNLNAYPIIYFGRKGNQAINNSFDRSAVLAITDFVSEYKPEVDGIAYVVNGELQEKDIHPAPSQPIDAIRIPVTTSGVYTITYKYRSSSDQSQFRKGVMSITVDIQNNNIEFVDEYDIITGSDNEDLKFSAAVIDNTVVISYKNNNATGGTLRFVTTALI